MPHPKSGGNIFMRRDLATTMQRFLPPPEPPLSNAPVFQFDRCGFQKEIEKFAKEVKRSVRIWTLILVLVCGGLLWLAYSVAYDPRIVVAVIGGNGLVAGLIIQKMMALDRQRILANHMVRILPFANDETVQNIIENIVKFPEAK